MNDKATWARRCALALTCALALNVPSAEARSPARQTAMEGVTTRVVDGDSLWFAPVQQGQRGVAIEVRLARIDAPELCQAHGRDSQRALVELALNKPGRLQAVVRDSYGRLIANLEVGGVDVATRLVEEGQAWSARQRNDRGPLVKQERMARALARGLHAPGGAVMPSDFRRSHGPCDQAAAQQGKKPATVAGAGLR